jgi:hypothetical protein
LLPIELRQEGRVYRRIAIIFAVSVALALLPHFAAAQFSVDNSSYEISVPRGWKSIPKRVLDAESAQTAAESPRARLPDYDYGFQLESVKTWLEYPVMLVKQIDSGRIPEYELTLMPRGDLRQLIQKAPATVDALLDEAHVGVMHYDQGAKKVWGILRAEGPGAGALRLSVVIPTEKGTLEVDSYAQSNEFLIYLPVFCRLAYSLALSSNLAYKPRAGGVAAMIERTDWHEVAIEAVLGGLIGGILAVLFMIQRKKED